MTLSRITPMRVDASAQNHTALRYPPPDGAVGAKTGATTRPAHTTASTHRGRTALGRAPVHPNTGSLPHTPNRVVLLMLDVFKPSLDCWSDNSMRVSQKQGRKLRFLQSQRNILLSAKVLPARTLDPISRTVLLRQRLFLMQTNRSPATYILQYL